MSTNNVGAKRESHDLCDESGFSSISIHTPSIGTSIGLCRIQPAVLLNVIPHPHP
jgi:hypothetical protein